MALVSPDTNITSVYTTGVEESNFRNSTFVSSYLNGSFGNSDKFKNRDIYWCTNLWGTSLLSFDNDLVSLTNTELNNESGNIVDFHRKFIKIKIKVNSISKYKPKFYF